jgi:tryptophan synthase
VQLARVRVLLMCVKDHSVSYIPLIAPTTSSDRMRHLCRLATSFVYVVSSLGVTGQMELALDAVKDIADRVTEAMKDDPKPFVIGFGVTTKDSCAHVGQLANGVVIGSHLLRLLTATEGDCFLYDLVFIIITDVEANEAALSQFIKDCSGELNKITQTHPAIHASIQQVTASLNGMATHFGDFGGQYAAESLMAPLQELEKVRLHPDA